MAFFIWWFLGLFSIFTPSVSLPLWEVSQNTVDNEVDKVDQLHTWLQKIFFCYRKLLLLRLIWRTQHTGKKQWLQFQFSLCHDCNENTQLNRDGLLMIFQLILFRFSLFHEIEFFVWSNRPSEMWGHHSIF